MPLPPVIDAAIGYAISNSGERSKLEPARTASGGEKPSSLGQPWPLTPPSPGIPSSLRTVTEAVSGCSSSLSHHLQLLRGLAGFLFSSRSLARTSSSRC